LWWVVVDGTSDGAKIGDELLLNTSLGFDVGQPDSNQMQMNASNVNGAAVTSNTISRAHWNWNLPPWARCRRTASNVNRSTQIWRTQWKIQAVVIVVDGTSDLLLGATLGLNVGRPNSDGPSKGCKLLWVVVIETFYGADVSDEQRVHLTLLAQGI
jgi:hypothetical protein